MVSAPRTCNGLRPLLIAAYIYRGTVSQLIALNPRLVAMYTTTSTV
jgi:hypothetical protein